MKRIIIQGDIPLRTNIQDIGLAGIINSSIPGDTKVFFKPAPEANGKKYFAFEVQGVNDLSDSEKSAIQMAVANKLNLETCRLGDIEVTTCAPPKKEQQRIGW